MLRGTMKLSAMSLESSIRELSRAKIQMARAATTGISTIKDFRTTSTNFMLGYSRVILLFTDGITANFEGQWS
jgi:hypothetical protein